MNEKNRNLLVRVVTAFSLLPVVFWLVYMGGIYLALLYGLAAALVAYEYYVMALGKVTPAAVAGIAGAFAMPLFPVIVPRDAGDLAFWWVTCFFVFFFAYLLFRGAPKDAPVQIAHLTIGMVYAATGTVALSYIRVRPDGGWWTIAALGITWGNDSAAYFVGRAIGRHKLYPLVSPNKTWEGWFGGLAGSVGFLFLLRALFFHGLTVLDCLALGIGGGILGPIGDLCESMLKRSYGVKDSGKLVPGHGGMLDRIDALLFNALFTFVYLQFARGSV